MVILAFLALASTSFALSKTPICDVVQTCSTFFHNITASAMNIDSDGSPLLISGTWELAFRYCTPATVSKDALQILLHGASYDKDFYWDDYVSFAGRQGYATLRYDRLGSGASLHPDPVAIVQAPLQIAIATEVIAQARNGNLLSLTYSRIIHVGHSFGSVITTGVLASSPLAIDIAVLTGYAHHPVPLEVAARAELTSANIVDPVRFGQLDSGYLTTLNITTRAAVFYSAPGTFSPEVLHEDENTKGTFAQGELSHNVSSALNFSGHIGAFIGADDILNCDPGCTNVPDEPMFFPAASYEFCHCVNLHHSAHDTFALIHEFLDHYGF